MFKKLVFSLLFLLSISRSAWADLHIDITEGTFKPVQIAITPFEGGGDPELTYVAQEISKVIANDLQNCGLFILVDPRAYIQNARDVMSHPRFADWKLLHAEALVGGLVKRSGNNLQVDFRLFDVFTETQLTGLALGTEPTNWRRVAHKIADEIYERITGDKGCFDTRIVYVAESGPEMSRSSRLAIMDQDGENHRFISTGNRRVLTPRFSPDRKQIAYVDFGANDKTPTLHIHNLETGAAEALGSVDGQKMSPRFSPHGDHIILSSAKKGAAALYKMNLSTKQFENITSTTSTIDVSPCYSPDETKIVFVSDRGGKPQIYVRDVGSNDDTRISFSPGRYDNPVWSPRGDLIAFTRQNGGTFYIGVMRPDGSGERMLDSGYLLEGPTWSPNGREVMYTCQASSNGKVELASVDIVGFHKRKVNIPGEGSYPTW